MMAQGQAMPENPAITEALAAQAPLFPVADLMKDLDEVSIEGTETVDGKQAVILKHGTSQYYFDMDSGLLLREVQSMMGQTATMTYSDYREVSGVMFPYTTTLTGMAPIPLEMTVTELKVNDEIDPSLFELD